MTASLPITIAAALLCSAAPAFAAPANLLPASFDDAAVPTDQATAQAFEPSADAGPIAAEPRDELDMFRLPPDWPPAVDPASADAPADVAESQHRLAPPDEADAITLYDRLGRERFLAHLATSAADVATTWRCSSHKRSCQEGNPAMRMIVGKRMSPGEAVLAFTAMQAVYVGGTLAVGAATGNPTGPAVAAFQWTLTAAHGIAAGLNLRF